MQVVDLVDEFRGEITVTILLDLNTCGQPRVEPGGCRIHIWTVVPPDILALVSLPDSRVVQSP